MARVLQYNATIVSRQDLTDLLTVWTVRPDEPLRPREGEPTDPWFVPGQYLTIGLNSEEGIDPEVEDGPERPPSVRRAMSIASVPQDHETIEFYIRLVTKPESKLPLTPLLWRRKAGSRIYVRTIAAGHFTVEHTMGADDPRLKVMVAAGTGLAPFVSIARARLRDDPGARLDDLAILHGVSYPSDLGYRDELERMAQENGLKYVPTVSRPHEAPDWKGCTGRVESLFEPGRLAELEERLGLPAGGLRPDRAGVLICGLNGTIAQCIDHLACRGFVPNHPRLRREFGVLEDVPSSLFYEQYDTTPPIDVKDKALMERLRGCLHGACVPLHEPHPLPHPS